LASLLRLYMATTRHNKVLCRYIFVPSFRRLVTVTVYFNYLVYTYYLLPVCIVFIIALLLMLTYVKCGLPCCICLHNLCIIFYIIRPVLDWLAIPVCSISYRGFDFDESPKWLVIHYMHIAIYSIC